MGLKPTYVHVLFKRWSISSQTYNVLACTTIVLTSRCDSTWSTSKHVEWTASCPLHSLFTPPLPFSRYTFFIILYMKTCVLAENPKGKNTPLLATFCISYYLLFGFPVFKILTTGIPNERKSERVIWKRFEGKGPASRMFHKNCSCSTKLKGCLVLL